MWERACSRMRSVSRSKYQLTDCIREQARSHIGVWCLPDAYLHHFFRLRLTIPKSLATPINLRVADGGAPL